MKLKSIAAGALLAVTASSFAAGGSLGLLDGSTAALANPMVATPFFFDTYTFTLGTVSSLSGSFTSTGITNFTAVLQDASFTTVGTDSNLGDGFSFAGLSVGNYAISLLGFSQGGGSYAGTVTAVPEPETYALMLAGLGMVAFMIKRRNAG